MSILAMGGIDLVVRKVKCPWRGDRKLFVERCVFIDTLSIVGTILVMASELTIPKRVVEIYQHPEEYHKGGNKGILKCPFLEVQ